MNVPAVARQSRGMTSSLAAGLGVGSHPRISIDSNKFTAIDASGNQLGVGGYDQALQSVYVDLIILDWNDNVSKVFYGDQPYNPNEATPPLCFSDNGSGPSRQSQQPQAPSCAACYWNTWGSDVSQMTGKATKGCNDVKKTAVILPREQFPYDMTFEFRIPPASLKNLRAYVNWVCQQKHPDADRALEITDLVTRVYFVSQGIMNFRPAAMVVVNGPDDQKINTLWAAEDAGQDATGSLVGKRDIPIDPRNILATMLDQSGAPLLAGPSAPELPQLPPPPAAAHVPPPQPPQGFGTAQPPAPAAAPPAPPAPRSGRGGARPGAGRRANPPQPPQGAAAPPAPPPPSGFGGQPAAPPAAAPAAPPPPASPAFQPTLATPAVPPPAGDPGPMPAFLNRAQPGGPPPPPPGAPVANPGFGTVNPPPPNAAVAGALKSAFGPLPGQQ